MATIYSESKGGVIQEKGTVARAQNSCQDGINHLQLVYTPGTELESFQAYAFMGVSGVTWLRGTL